MTSYAKIFLKMETVQIRKLSILSGFENIIENGVFAPQEQMLNFQ